MKPLVTAALIITATPALTLDLKLTAQFDLNYPSSLEYDPDFCGLWIANEGPEAILVTLDGLELRRVTSDLYRIKALTIHDNALIVADGLGSFQKLAKTGAPLAPPSVSTCNGRIPKASFLMGKAI